MFGLSVRLSSLFSDPQLLHVHSWLCQGNLWLLLCPIESQDIFDSSINDQDLWKLAIRNLGGQVSLLANSPLDPNLN